MVVNFEEIPSDIEVPDKPPVKTKTVLEELTESQSLLNERTIKCKDIRPFFERAKKDPLRYMYKYFCICPRFNPKYLCKHTGNIIIDRDVLTHEEHIIFLATPKANFAEPRKMPRYLIHKYIVPKCTARVHSLAAPDKKQVNDTLTNFSHIIPKWRKRLLKTHLQKKPIVSYTTIPLAIEWLREEIRLKKVAKRNERKCLQKLARKIVRKQRIQIRKIICVLFEEMKDFLLNDQFIMDENSSLVSVILEALREFADKAFYITSNLREYQKILAFNLAVWINKFISNLNIHVAEPATHYSQMPQPQPERPTHELSSFIPLSDYISYSSASDEYYYVDEDQSQGQSQQAIRDRTQNTDATEMERNLT